MQIIRWRETTSRWRYAPIVLVVGIIIACGSGTTSPGDSGDKADTKPQPASVTADAATMLKEFQDNELSADAKYKGKWVQVNGTVEKIDTEIFDDTKYVMNIAGGSDFE